MFVTVLILLCSCRHSSSLLSENSDTQMVEKGQYPFMAYIVGDDGSSCSATIPSLKATLTTAKCLMNCTTWAAWAGTNRLRLRDDFEPPTQHRRITRITLSVDPDLYDIEAFDVGIGWVEKPWEQSHYVRPVALWIQTEALPFEFLEELKVLAWGYGVNNASDRELRSTLVTIGSSIMCPTLGLQRSRQFMCSNEGMFQTICKGDHGGAVIADFPLVGTVQLAMVKSLVPPVARRRRSRPHLLDPACKLPAPATIYVFLGFFRVWLWTLLDDMLDYQYNWKPPNESAILVKDILSGRKSPLTKICQERPLPTSSNGTLASTPPLLLPTALCLLLLPRKPANRGI